MQRTYLLGLLSRVYGGLLKLSKEVNSLDEKITKKPQQISLGRVCEKVWNGVCYQGHSNYSNHEVLLCAC